jgi:hypothetical protein
VDSAVFRARGGSLAASLSNLLNLEEAQAKKKRKRKNRNKSTKNRCKKIGVGCNPGSKHKCCSGLVCDTVESLGGLRCCKQILASCAPGDQCCGNLVCLDGVCVGSGVSANANAGRTASAAL